MVSKRKSVKKVKRTVKRPVNKVLKKTVRRSPKKTIRRIKTSRTSRKPSGLKLLSIKKSTRPEKKLMATFSDGTVTHFGAAGMSDYTKHKDPERMKRYRNRHKARENWKDPRTAGALALYVLWNKPSLRASIADYKRRFKL